MISKNIFFINILLLAFDESQVVANQNDFRVLKNQDISMTVGESSFISSVYKQSRMQCMTVCSANSNCKTAVYDNSQGRFTNCFTYNRYFKTSELMPSSTGVVYEKKICKIFITPKRIYFMTFDFGCPKVPKSVKSGNLVNFFFFRP